MPVCADCRAVVDGDGLGKVGGPRWGEIRYDVHGKPDFVSFTCRTEIDWSDPENPRCLAADYHYVEGEEQRRWRLNGEA